jgi:hypothetical protein
MQASSHPLDGSRRTASLVRRRIERGGERLWRYQDFAGLPFASVAQALSRLTRAGLIERLSKGIYYRTRQTSFGPSRPNPAAIRHLASQQSAIFPAGLAAANLLGFTTQNPKHGEIATTAPSLPRKLIGSDTLVHTRRPAAWTGLSDMNAASLDFLRQGGKSSELSPEGTVRKMLALVSENGRFEHLLKVAHSEPPRVRAMLGAIGEEIGKSPRILNRIRTTLNPLSRFDFGMFSGLRYAHSWQAKERRPREVV